MDYNFGQAEPLVPPFMFKQFYIYGLFLVQNFSQIHMTLKAINLISMLEIMKKMMAISYENLFLLPSLYYL